MVDAAQAVVTVEGALACITLNRPSAINALTLAMVRRISVALDAFEHDQRVRALLLTGSGSRGFCAGGDIVSFYHSALADGVDAQRFWQEEYRLNARIAHYPKPIIAFMDGIVMGGGVGLSGHASHRVATERLVWAMPEVRIGFAPDVGGTFLLSRAPGELGVFLAATGERIGPGDAIHCNFADFYVRSDALDDLRSALRDGDADGALDDAADQAPAAELPRALIDRCFKHARGREIVDALNADSDAHAPILVAAIHHGSPTAVEVAIKAVRRARKLPSVDACLEQEYRTSCKLLAIPDFVEGIRAAVINKDRQPRWSPATLGEPSPATIDAFF